MQGRMEGADFRLGDLNELPGLVCALVTGRASTESDCNRKANREEPTGLRPCDRKGHRRALGQRAPGTQRAARAGGSHPPPLSAPIRGAAGHAPVGMRLERVAHALVPPSGPSSWICTVSGTGSAAGSRRLSGKPCTRRCSAGTWLKPTRGEWTGKGRRPWKSLHTWPGGLFWLQTTERAP